MRACSLVLCRLLHLCYIWKFEKRGELTERVRKERRCEYNRSPYLDFLKVRVTIFFFFEGRKESDVLSLIWRLRRGGNDN